MKLIVVMMATMIALIQAAPAPGSVDSMNPSDAAARAKQIADQYFNRYTIPDAGLAAPQNRPPSNDKAKQTLKGVGRTVKNLPDAPPVPISGVGSLGLISNVAGGALGG